jgi:hypothetical protein
MIKTIDIDLTYRPTIDGPPAREGDLFQKAASNDQATVHRWRDVWVDLTKKAKERFGSFSEKSIGKLYGINRMKPVIICGSGPSLKTSIESLKNNAKSEHPVMVVSCLHNFGYFEDEGFHADYYLTLDSGEITVADVFEGRKQPPEHYWEATKGKKLLATVATHPTLFDLWQGEIILFNVMIPDLEIQTKIQEVERFTHYLSPGGNALGGVFYAAKAIFCSDPVIFVGADFCFDTNNQFHSYATHYDAPGSYVMWPSIYSELNRKTWPSYLNFKFFFDHCACKVPGNYINCSEGLLGAYPEGNIRQFKYMTLRDALLPYVSMDVMSLKSIDMQTGNIISSEELRLKDLFSNSQYPKDLVLF